MPKYYFNFHDGEGGGRDEEGKEFTIVESARREAFAALGDEASEFSRQASDGQVRISVRDNEATIMELAATFSTGIAR